MGEQTEKMPWLVQVDGAGRETMEQVPVALLQQAAVHALVGLHAVPTPAKWLVRLHNGPATSRQSPVGEQQAPESQTPAPQALPTPRENDPEGQFAPVTVVGVTTEHAKDVLLQHAVVQGLAGVQAAMPGYHLLVWS